LVGWQRLQFSHLIPIHGSSDFRGGLAARYTADPTDQNFVTWVLLPELANNRNDHGIAPFGLHLGRTFSTSSFAAGLAGTTSSWL
jgi:hypothetical protein